MVKRLRLEHGWSQTELARRAGLGLHTVQRIELGGRNVQINSLFQLSTALDAELIITLATPDESAQMVIRSPRRNVMAPAREQPDD